MKPAHKAEEDLIIEDTCLSRGRRARIRGPEGSTGASNGGILFMITVLVVIAGLFVLGKECK
jgi:hypothetical protein